MVIGNIRLVLKTGGKSGTYRRAGTSGESGKAGRARGSGR